MTPNTPIILQAHSYQVADDQPDEITVSLFAGNAAVTIDLNRSEAERLRWNLNDWLDANAPAAGEINKPKNNPDSLGQTIETQNPLPPTPQQEGPYFTKQINGHPYQDEWAVAIREELAGGIYEESVVRGYSQEPTDVADALNAAHQRGLVERREAATLLLELLEQVELHLAAGKITERYCAANYSDLRPPEGYEEARAEADAFVDVRRRCREFAAALTSPSNQSGGKG